MKGDINRWLGARAAAPSIARGIVGFCAALMFAPAWAQSAAGSDGVPRSAGPADPSDNVQHVAGPADPSDDLYPAGKHARPAVEALPPLGAEGEAGPFLFGLSASDIIGAALAGNAERADLGVVLEQLRKPFDPARFGTLHHAVGRDGLLRILHRNWELLLAQVPDHEILAELRRLTDDERESLYARRYPHGVADDDPYWGVVDGASGVSRSGCSGGSITTTTAASGLWKVRSESYFQVYTLGVTTHIYYASYGSTHHRSCTPVCWWVKKAVDTLSVAQSGEERDCDGGVAVHGWVATNSRRDDKEVYAYMGDDISCSSFWWTSEVTASDSRFGTLVATSCRES